jgi:hypothetical protein
VRSLRAAAAKRAREAVGVLASIATDANAPPDVRVRAAESLLNCASSRQPDGIVLRMLWTLRALGRARRQGVLLIDENAPPGRKAEVKTVLDELSKFAEQIQNEYPE